MFLVLRFKRHHVSLQTKVGLFEGGVFVFQGLDLLRSDLLLILEQLFLCLGKRGLFFSTKLSPLSFFFHLLIEALESSVIGLERM